jgi:flagellar basal body-associated protein FliL
MDPNIPAQPVQPEIPTAQPIVPLAPEPKSKLSKWIIVAVVIIFLVIASGATAFFLNKNQNIKTQTAKIIPTQTVVKPTI